MAQTQNIIFWGAGATAALGIRTTDAQTQFIKRITGADSSDTPLEERVAAALGSNDMKLWHSALFDLITILGDTEDAYDSIHATEPEQLDAMRRNWRDGADDEELQRRIINLRLIYDWPALKSVVRICPGSSTANFKLNDLFNILDMHIPAGFGFRAPARHGHSGADKQHQEQFFDARRLIGAKNALLMILIALFYIDYQICISSKRDILEKYLDFAKVLGGRIQGQAADLFSKHRLDQPAFYQSDVGFVSLNYDPIALWVRFVANRDLNNSMDVPRIGTVPLHLFHDFGHLIPARRISRGEGSWPWYPLNEGGAQRLNEQEAGDSRVRLTKFLFPHGCLCWRECPNCGKLSAYHGDQWDLHTQSLFPPPPLRAFEVAGCPTSAPAAERDQREKGLVDARGCLHCGTLTYTHHTQAVMQSSFKSRPPSFIEEIQRDLRATLMRANHIILMGYSLPQDDVTYRAFFSASCQRHKGPSEQQVRCTVVGKESGHPGWYGPTELRALKLPKDHAVNATVDIFGDGNVRFYGGGVPDVFLDNGKVTTAQMDQLLTWRVIS
jgi:uncharacterized membrane protein YsdA (DUF1294 family)